MANLGFQNHAMTVDNLDLKIIAKDASLLRGRNGENNAIITNSVEIGPGESRDVLFTAPAQAGEFLLYDRTYAYASNGGGAGYGGMATKIVVTSPLPDQTAPNA